MFDTKVKRINVKTSHLNKDKTSRMTIVSSSKELKWTLLG